MTTLKHGDWLDFAYHRDTGIETLQAHFEGHAYDPHWHDSYLVGVTQQGVQRFSCGRRRHDSTPGKVMLLAPGEVHDGDAPAAGGFTYQALYLSPQWLDASLRELFEEVPSHFQLGFASPLLDDPRLAEAITHAFRCVHQGASRLERDSALDQLLDQLTRPLRWRAPVETACRLPQAVLRARDYLHAHSAEDISLAALAEAAGMDRFRLTRAFRSAFGLPPHAYLVQWRLVQARRLLRQGLAPASVAATVGFADQSHLGRWFRRAFGLTPAHYRRLCSNVPD